LTEEEFTEFYTHSVARLTGQIYLVTGDLHEAQDVVQEAFVKAWAHRSALVRDHAPEAWVRTTAGRLAVSRWRRAQSAARAWLRHGHPSTVAEPGPGHVDIAAALRTLPPRQRLCAALHYVCDLPLAQVAGETGIAEGTVKAHLARARAALAPLLTLTEESVDDLR
jgi:RNA polymerase sigma-70 factor (ECF subfamily)